MDVGEPYAQAVMAGDAGRALELLEQALLDGVPSHQLITDVLARVQRIAGERWLRGEWGVADEYAVTALTKRALAVLAAPLAGSGASLHVVIACTDGEWHSVPARMAAELLSGKDTRVEVLGASTAPDTLRQHLRATAPDVLALSVTMSASLLSAAESIEVAREEGVPVVVGGQAWGRGQHRARALGAHLRLEDIRDIPRRLDEIRALSPPPLLRIPAEARWLDHLSDVVLRRAYDCYREEEQPADDPHDGPRRRWEADQRWTCRHLAVALACEDPSVVSDLLAWACEMRRARGQSTSAVLRSALCLAAAIEDRAPVGADLLRRGVDAEGGRVAMSQPEVV